MSKNKCNKKGNNTLNFVVVLGIAFVLIGLILLAFNIGWLNPASKSIIFSWPMLLIILAIIGYIKRQKVFPTILLLLGIFFILPRLENVYPGILGNAGKDFTSNYWPFLLIALGLILIIKVASNRNKRVSAKNNVVDTQTTIEAEGWISKDIVFGGSESVFTEPVFKGGDIDVAFGGVVIDLRKTTLPNTTVYLNMDIIFGGIKLYVPEDWCVQSNLDSVFGGYSDKRPNAAIANGESNCKLILQGSLIFSGCAIQ
ncbi:MAG: cell wall-active antibiotics response protein [Bacteroidales bacterium]|nr:cell wall-active antibiotics response protein [Bacteroidales bacterium]